METSSPSAARRRFKFNEPFVVAAALALVAFLPPPSNASPTMMSRGTTAASAAAAARLRRPRPPSFRNAEAAAASSAAFGVGRIGEVRRGNAWGGGRRRSAAPSSSPGFAASAAPLPIVSLSPPPPPPTTSFSRRFCASSSARRILKATSYRGSELGAEGGDVGGGGGGGGRLSDFEAEFFDPVDDAPKPTKTTTTAANPSWSFDEDLDRPPIGIKGERGSFSEYESRIDPYPSATGPRAEGLGAAGAEREGRGGGRSPVAAGDGRPMASRSSSTRAVVRAEPTTARSANVDALRRKLEPGASHPSTEGGVGSPDVPLFASHGRRRPMPPPVSEYDYDDYDDDMGVSAAFGDYDPYGGRGGRLKPPRAIARRAGSSTSPAIAGADVEFWDGIEGVDDPDYDPYFSVDADMDASSEQRLPETEQDAHWAGEEEDLGGGPDNASYGLIGDDVTSGATADSTGRTVLKRTDNVEPRKRPVTTKGGNASSFRSAEDFLDGLPDPPPSDDSRPRYDDAASVFGTSPVAAPPAPSTEEPTPAAGAAKKDAAGRRSSLFAKIEEEVGRPQANEGGGAPRRKNWFDDDDDDEVKDDVIAPTKESSRYSEIEDEVSKPSRPITSRSYEPYEPSSSSPPPMARADSSEFLSSASSGDGVSSTVSVLTTRLDKIKADAIEANGGVEFNPNSPKQVAWVLYGKDGAEGQKTDRDTLEALASAGNKAADLVLKYRRCLRELRREERKEENRANGNHVTSMGDMHRNRRKTVTGYADGKSAAAGKEHHPRPKKYHFNSTSLNSDPLLLVDASAYVFRAYFSMPPLHRSDGTPVGAVLGFCNMLNRLVLSRTLSGQRPRLALVFDAPGKNFRHDMYDEYKANRPPCPVDLVPQFELVREAAFAYGVPQVEASGYEADDLIATLARRAVEEGVDVNVLSGDKDLMQLVTPPDAVPGVHMIDPMNMVHITHDAVTEKWGVPPELVGDVLALAGDSSDNVPGVPGIGPKIAATLINEFGSLEGVLENAEQIKQEKRRENVLEHADMARLSRSLVELDRHVPLNETTTVPESFASVGDMRMKHMSATKLLDFYDRMGFRDLKRRVKARLRAAENKNLSNARTEADGTESSGDDDGSDESSSAARAETPIGEGEEEVDAIISSTSGDTGSGSTTGLFVHRRDWAEPPKPEDYSDVPF